MDLAIIPTRWVSNDVKLLTYYGFVTGVVSGQLTLEPPTGHFCPNVNVTYTCHGSQVELMSWSAKPYISGNDAINYSPGFIYANNETMIFIEGTDNRFFSSLTSIMFNRHDVTVANITTTLRVITSGLDNGTNITCETYRGRNRSRSSSILYFAGMY